MKLNLAVLPGDGIGPEIIDQALRVIKAVCNKLAGEQVRAELRREGNRRPLCPGRGRADRAVGDPV